MGSIRHISVGIQGEQKAYRCGYIIVKESISVWLHTWEKEAYICAVIYIGNRWHICVGTYWEHEAYTDICGYTWGA